MIGRTVEVLVEGPSKNDPHTLTGRTRTNHIVHFPGAGTLAGSLVRVEIQQATPLTLSGHALPRP